MGAVSSRVFGVLLAFVLAILLVLCTSGCAAQEQEASYERFDKGRGVETDVVTDQKTGVQCLLARKGYGGGVAVLVGADGKLLLADGYGDAE